MADMSEFFKNSGGFPFGASPFGIQEDREREGLKQRAHNSKLQSEREQRSKDVMPLVDAMQDAIMTIMGISSMMLPFATSGGTAILTAIDETIDSASKKLDNARTELRKLRQKYSNEQINH